MEIYLNSENLECVVIKGQDGTTWSGLKSTYDEILSAQEKQSGTL